MKKADFYIDKLTNSIENIKSGDSFPIEISLVKFDELKILNKKSGWRFKWLEEFKKPYCEIYKLTINNNPKIIQGLISLEIKNRSCFYASYRECSI